LPLQTSKNRILVVDDYADAAESLVMVLEAEGYEVKTANCGLQALEQVQVFQPQIVLLDIGLPDLDGYEVAKRLRTIPENENMLVIALTGYGQRKQLEHAESSGFDHYLLKPVDFDKLFSLLASSPIASLASIEKV
jgi:CheY-like chemotaxis protein